MGGGGGRFHPPCMDRVNNIVRSMCTFLLLQKIVCPASAESILDKTFCLSPFLDTGQPDKRFINIKNHVFGHATGEFSTRLLFMKAFENGDAI